MSTHNVNVPASAGAGRGTHFRARATHTPDGYTPDVAAGGEAAVVAGTKEQVATGQISPGTVLIGGYRNMPDNGDATVYSDKDGLTILDGALTFIDAYGTTALDGSGFGPAWQRFLSSGLFNGDFYQPPPALASVIDNLTNPLPHWTFAHRSGTAITAKTVAYLTNATGYAVEFTMTAGAAGDDSYIEQITPVNASANRAYSFSPFCFIDCTVGSADMELYVEYQFLLRDGATATGAAYTTAAAIGGPVLSEWGGLTGDTQPPADAYFMRTRYGLRRRSGGSNAATGVLAFVETYIVAGSPRIDVPENTDPGTYTHGSIGQGSGVIQITPDVQGAANGWIGVGAGGLLVHGNLRIVSGHITESDNGSTTVTPTISNAGTATFSLNTMTYQVIGDLVHFAFELVVNSAGAGGGTIAVSLPFAVSGSNQVVSGFVQGFSVITDGSAYALLTAAGSAVATIRDRTNTGLARSHFVNGAICRITGSYQKAP